MIRCEAVKKMHPRLVTDHKLENDKITFVFDDVNYRLEGFKDSVLAVGLLIDKLELITLNVGLDAASDMSRE
jgi:hypothetical protein